MSGPVIHDLGVLDGDVLVFGGPYSNLQATEALIAEAKRRGIPPGRCICTGDAVAYCADPDATLTALRGFGCALVAGNCEKQLADGATDCGCGFDADSACDLLSAGWFAHVDRCVGAPDRAWMGARPDMIVFRQGAVRCAVIHGGVTDIARFLWPVSAAAAFAEEIAAVRALAGSVDVILAGHCGVAFQRQIGDVTWVNAGAIGMPPHDGRTATRYAVLTEGKAMLHRLDYDHAAAAGAMRKAGLTQGYDAGLLSGIWPSEDNLPPALRRG